MLLMFNGYQALVPASVKKYIPRERKVYTIGMFRGPLLGAPSLQAYISLFE